MANRLILASNSPRRKEILAEAGFTFDIIKSQFEEGLCDRSPEETVKQFATAKAKDVYDRLGDNSAVVLGSDTVVSLDGKILGKPISQQDAKQMLKNLSGKTHQVWTGYCIITSEKTLVNAVKTDVVFNELSDQLINEYIATGKPMDKAGAYGIQDGFDLVKEYRGSYDNVVGLPLECFIDELKSLIN